MAFSQATPSYRYCIIQLNNAWLSIAVMVSPRSKATWRQRSINARSRYTVLRMLPFRGLPLVVYFLVFLAILVLILI